MRLLTALVVLGLQPATISVYAESSMSVGTLVRLRMVQHAILEHLDRTGSLPVDTGESSWLHKVLWPATTSALDEFSTGVSEAWLESRIDPTLSSRPADVVVVDAWGLPLQYRVRNGDFSLYSFGRDGEDNGGNGDDLVAGEKLSWWHHGIGMRHRLQIIGLCAILAVAAAAAVVARRRSRR